MWPLLLTEGQHVCVVFEIQKGSGIYHTTLSSQLGPIIWKGQVTRVGGSVGGEGVPALYSLHDGQ